LTTKQLVNSITHVVEHTDVCIRIILFN